MVPCTSTTNTANIMDRIRSREGSYSWGRSGDRKGHQALLGCQLRSVSCWFVSGVGSVFRNVLDLSFVHFFVCMSYFTHTHTEARFTCVRFSYRLTNYANFLWISNTQKQKKQLTNPLVPLIRSQQLLTHGPDVPQATTGHDAFEPNWIPFEGSTDRIS